MKRTVTPFGKPFDIEVGETTPEQQLERRVATTQGRMADYGFIYGTAGKLGGAQTERTVTPSKPDPVQEHYRDAAAYLCQDVLFH